MRNAMLLDGKWKTGPIDRSWTLPGAVGVPGRGFRNVSCHEDRSADDLSLRFKKVVGAVDPPRAEGGGVINEDRVLVLPTDECSIGLSYKGDLAGWRLRIEEGAKRLDLHVAWIEGDDFGIDDGRELRLADCSLQASA